METKKPSVINIGLVGGGEMCADILKKTTSVYEREEIYAPIVAVADSDPESPGMRAADELGLLTFTDYHQLYDDRYSIHLIIILTLALVPLRPQIDEEAVVIVSPPEYSQDTFELIDEVTYSDVPQVEVGANSTADSEMAEASAEMFAEIAEIPNPIELEPTDLGKIMQNKN